MPQLDLFDVILIGIGLTVLVGHYIWSKYFKKRDDDERSEAEPPTIMRASIHDEEEDSSAERYR